MVAISAPDSGSAKHIPGQESVVTHLEPIPTRFAQFSGRREAQRASAIPCRSPADIRAPSCPDPAKADPEVAW